MNWIRSLRRCKERDDRGMMASLRCILVDNKKHRAWPALNRLGIKIDDDILTYVAGLYASHPEETSTGNFGTTCENIKMKRDDAGSNDSKLTPTERRFQHLLAAERDEVQKRVLRMIIMAKKDNVPVNYEKLATDLKFWNGRTKIEWAAAFWTQGDALEEEEL